MFTAALFTVAKTWKQLNCSSTDEQLKKMRYIHIMGYHSFIKKEQNLAIYSNMGRLEGITLREIVVTEKEKHCMISLICEI